jgi:hypothetical protein
MKLNNRTYTRLLVVSIAGMSMAALPCSAANIFFSFQTTEDGALPGVQTLDVTAFEGVAGTPTISMTGSDGNAYGQGGEASFTAYDGTTWLGDNDYSLPGRSLVWNDAVSNLSLSLNFDATGLEDISIRFAVRSAGSGAITSFTDLTYDLGDGAGAVSTGLTLDSFDGDGNFNEWTIDLSSIAAIENQSDVTLTWSIPTFTDASFRIDNLQLTAIPEPSSAALLMGLSVGALLVSRRRRS